MAWEFSVLVVANVTASSDELLDALRERSEAGACHFTLVMPATGPDRRERLDAALERMREAGLDNVEGSVGDPDPVVAVMDIWDPMKFDDIVVSTLPTGSSRWMGLDLPHRLEKLTSVPVRHVVSHPASGGPHGARARAAALRRAGGVRRPDLAALDAMDIEEAMRTQRAIRRLRPDPVDDSLVLHLIELALKAPTGGNAQNWEFIVVKDREVKRRLGRLNMQAWRLYGGLGRVLMRRRPAMLRVIEAVEWQARHFEEIPVLVVACLRGVRAPFPPLAATSYYGSIYPSVQNLLLAARAAELGAALITLPLWSSFLARRTLGLPWNVSPCAVVPLGWPLGRYGPTTRRPVGEVVSVDRYGQRPFASS